MQKVGGYLTHSATCHPERILARPSESAFTGLAKTQQSHFRDVSPTVSAAARGPTDDAGRRHGHLLALGCEEENLYPVLRGPGGAIDHFRARKIKWWRSAHSGDIPGSGPTRNLTSSQVCCVNFLLPLATVPGALLALLRSIDDDLIEVATIEYPAPSGTGTLQSPVEFEWAGLNTSLEGGPVTRGAHCTSCDALLIGVTQGGSRRAYLVEWKYAEAYEHAQSLANDRRRGRYQQWLDNTSGSLGAELRLDELLYDPIYQIVRLAFLGDLMVRDATFGVTETRVVVVCPPENGEYRDTITSPELVVRFPECTTLEALAEKLWRQPLGFRMRSQSELLSALRAQHLPALAPWEAYHHERYGW